MQIGAEPFITTSPLRRPATSPEKEGALVIIDSFQSSGAHGHQVEGAAASLGPTGPVVRIHQHQQVDGRASMPHVRAFQSFQSAMLSPLLPEQAAGQLEKFVDQAAGGNLSWATTLLAGVTAEGFQHSVLNFSQGLDAITLLHLLKHPTSASSKLPPEAKQVYVENLARAVAPEAQVPLSEPELDNLLLQSLKRSLKESPAVRQATEGWRAEVRYFEAGNNSVVVAAGNAGVAQKALARAGFAIDGSEDSSIFAVPEVTVVGATVVGQNGVSLAAPSSFGPEVDFLAPGDFQANFGTSFASPKVANAFRAAHLANPELSSDQVEEWVKTELSEPALVEGHQVALLDTGRARSFLRIQG